MKCITMVVVSFKIIVMKDYLFGNNFILINDVEETTLYIILVQFYR